MLSHVREIRKAGRSAEEELIQATFFLRRSLTCLLRKLEDALARAWFLATVPPCSMSKHVLAWWNSVWVPRVRARLRRSRHKQQEYSPPRMFPRITFSTLGYTRGCRHECMRTGHGTSYVTSSSACNLRILDFAGSGSASRKQTALRACRFESMQPVLYDAPCAAGRLYDGLPPDAASDPDAGNWTYRLEAEFPPGFALQPEAACESASGSNMYMPLAASEKEVASKTPGTFCPEKTRFSRGLFTHMTWTRGKSCRDAHTANQAPGPKRRPPSGIAFCPIAQQ